MVCWDFVNKWWCSLNHFLQISVSLILNAICCCNLIRNWEMLNLKYDKRWHSKAVLFIGFIGSCWSILEAALTGECLRVPYRWGHFESCITWWWWCCLVFYWLPNWHIDFKTCFFKNMIVFLFAKFCWNGTGKLCFSRNMLQRKLFWTSRFQPSPNPKRFQVRGEVKEMTYHCGKCQVSIGFYTFRVF